MWSIPGSANPVSTQPIVDAQLLDARGTVDFWVYAIYPDTEIDGQAPTNVSGINTTYYAHRASTRKQYVKRCVYLQHDWTGDSTFQAGWIAWLLNEFADPGYMRIDGKPVVVLFSAVTWDGDATAKANWLAMKAAFAAAGQPVYAYSLGAIAPTSWTNLQLNGGTSYDAGLGCALSPNGQHPWSDVVTKDQGNAGVANFDIIETVTMNNDRRARAGSESTTPWADPPTVLDLLTAAQFARNSGAKVVMLGPKTEIDETGSPDAAQAARRFYDPWDWANGYTRPGTYTDEIDVRTKYCVQTGTWTRTNSIAGAFDGDEISSSTANDTIAITCNAHVVPAAGGTITITGPMGAGLGTFDTLVNGVSQGTTSQVGSTAHRVALKSVSVSLNDVVTFKVVSGTCTIDTFRVTFAP